MMIADSQQLTPSIALASLVMAKRLGHKNVTFFAEEWALLDAIHQDAIRRLAEKADVRVEIIA